MVHSEGVCAMAPFSNMGKRMKAGDTLLIPIITNDYYVVVCWGNSKQVAKVLKRQGYPEGEDIVQLDCNRGQTFSREGCPPIIALPNRPKTNDEIGTLAHEAVHAVEAIFDAIGQPKCDEVFAYGVGAIVREVLNIK